MNITRCLLWIMLAGGLAERLPAGAPAAESWTPERITAAEQSLDQLKAGGLITEVQYRKKRAMLAERRAGQFKSTALSNTNPTEINLIQNAGFEEINRNSAKNRSRWLWWGGWSWDGDYENFWESAKENVHSGNYSAGIRCTGKRGRIGLNTPRLPIVPGATNYVFTVWAKGEGDNQLFLNFESGATGTLRQHVGPAWEQITLKAKPEPGAKDFSLFIYVTGGGVIYLDDAKLAPEGGTLDED